LLDDEVKVEVEGDEFGRNSDGPLLKDKDNAGKKSAFLHFAGK